MCEVHRLSAEKGPRDFAAQRRADVSPSDLTVGVGRMHRNRRTTQARPKLPLLSGLTRLPSCVSGVHSMASWVSPDGDRRMRRTRGRVLSVPWTVSGDPSAIEACGRRRRRVCAAATVAVRSATRRGQPRQLHSVGRLGQKAPTSAEEVTFAAATVTTGTKTSVWVSHGVASASFQCCGDQGWWRAARYRPMRRATWPGSRCPGG
jgi:hypothetical protein